MMKFKVLVVLTAGVFSASSTFAGDKACCATTASNKSAQACEATFANLNLTAEQKTKMEKLAADCTEGGCNKATMAKMEKGARGVLSKEQFESWKAACTAKMGEHAHS